MAIQEHTLELAIIELNRCLKVLKQLRDWGNSPYVVGAPNKRGTYSAAAKRASMDATRILADLRQGR